MSNVVLFYGFEVEDRKKAEELMAAEDHADNAWQSSEFGDGNRPIVPDDYKCNFTNHTCSIKLLQLWDPETERISNKYCKLVRYGDLFTYEWTIIALGVSSSVHGTLENKKGLPKNFTVNKKWNQYLKDFAEILEIKYETPQWINKSITL